MILEARVGEDVWVIKGEGSDDTLRKTCEPGGLSTRGIEHMFLQEA